jgi:hypothetical protein
MSAARAILGNPAKSPPVLPTLLGMNTPPGASTRAVADGGWFIHPVPACDLPTKR